MRVTLDIPTPRLPRRRATRLLTVFTVVALLAAPGIALASHLFDDVPNSSPFHGNISALAGSGVTAGCGGDNFCPKDYVTREQMAAFLGRGLGRVTLSDLTTMTLPTIEQTVWSFTITPGIPGGAVPGATQFVQANATITLNSIDNTGCPCTYRGTLYVSGVGYMVERVADVTLDTISQKANMSMTGAIGVTGAGTRTVEVHVWRLSGSGAAQAYGNATAMTVPYGGSGTSALMPASVSSAADVSTLAGR